MPNHPDQQPDPSPVAQNPSTNRFPALWIKFALLVLGAALLTASFAPVGQFYLAWIGLIPWLLVVRQSSSARAAFFWSWLAGAIFFAANIWWIAYITLPGALALFLYLGLYWSLAALIMRGTRLLPSIPPANPGDDDTPPIPARRPNAILALIALPTIWVGLEWLRGTVFPEVPWLLLGHSQSPLLPMCQIADFGGACVVSWWVVMLNVILLILFLGRRRYSAIPAAAALALLILAASLAYGIFRIQETPGLSSPGPRIMVVQSNFPQSNTGDKGASVSDNIKFHIGETALGLKRGPVDLIVWSETVVPPINHESLDFWRDHQRLLATYIDMPTRTHDLLSELARQSRSAILTGGAWVRWGVSPHDAIPPMHRLEQRNAAYYFQPSGKLASEHYDKIHLVPFGEYTPFQTSFPPLYHFFHLFNPYEDPAAYELKPGREDALTVFVLKMRSAQPESPVSSAAALTPSSGETAAVAAAPTSVPATAAAMKDASLCRFVTPICFEDIDGPLVARMFRPSESGSQPNRKRADLIVNITNDGWFRANEMSQHLQAASFRSIENRVPTARSVNTGISGFIDSTGHPFDLVGASIEGFSISSLKLDARLTFYTRHGDIIAEFCAGWTGLLALIGLVRWRNARRRKIAARKLRPVPAEQ